jgi:hypothetical protein
MNIEEVWKICYVLNDFDASVWNNFNVWVSAVLCNIIFKKSIYKIC